MFSNRSVYDSRVAGVLVPLCSRLMKEADRLQHVLETVDDANREQSGQYVNLYLRKLLSQLKSPREFFCLGGSEQLKVRPKRKSEAYVARYIAENLHKLQARIRMDDLDIGTPGSGHSRLSNALAYYRLALKISARCCEVDVDAEAIAGDSVRKRLGELRKMTDKLLAVPESVLDQFNEPAYLQANFDVKAALADGEFICGLEHFAMQGLQEALGGGRPVPGVDLGIAKCETDAAGSNSAEHIRAAIASSGIFDSKWYKRSYGIRRNQLKHYCNTGYKLGFAPNALFDSQWYCEQNPGVDGERVNPAFHYINYGEERGCMPCEKFVPLWYRQEYGIEGELALSHYLREGIKAGLNPNPLFDTAYYLDNNSDVVAAKMNPVDHFYRFGWKERRNTKAGFDVDRYVVERLDNISAVNPVTHALLNGYLFETKPDVAVAADAQSMTEQSSLPSSQSLHDVASNIKYFANPGPGFETPSPLNCGNEETRAKTVAFYLPQFHAFEENDEWWGAGFSEWRNVSRGAPRYAGHYQPRIPRDLGFYDLNDPSVLKKQSEMALANGIEAFCFYYYWFNGKRLLDMPLDQFAGNDEIDQEFCIMWANENWTRTWDGFDREVLMEQNYRDEDEEAFLEDTAWYFRNKRYMHVNGRPLFILYRPGLLPRAKQTLARWRQRWTDMLDVEPLIMMVQGFGDEDPVKFGLDGAVEFPPHKVCTELPEITDQLSIVDPAFTGHVRSYTDVIRKSLSEEAPDFPLVKTVVPHWDNDARREGRGFTLHGSTPALYESWLNGAMDYAIENPVFDEPLVFVNAWNEWAEGAYLEPDVHYGHAYLNATKRAAYGHTRSSDRQKLLLVGHDAYRHGAQMLLLSMARIYQNQFGLEVTILLKDGGPLLPAYQEVCNTVLLNNIGRDNLDGWLRNEIIDIAICNTSVTGDLVPLLEKSGVAVISLIHELPNLIREFKLSDNLHKISESAKHVVFPSEIVEEGFMQFVDDVQANRVIRPQGTYKHICFDAAKRAGIRSDLGILPDEKLVLNVGYADLRKGFDIFLQIARQLVAERADVHFAWVGGLSPDMERWVQSDLDESMRKRIHMIGYTDNVTDYYSACDCLFLTSREDPYPTVVLEAMDVGAPVVLFKSATGFDTVVGQYGAVVDRNDNSQITRALVHSLYNDSRAEKDARKQYVSDNCQFDDYCFALLQMLRPDLKKVSVVIPNYNYADYLKDRMRSVFSQNHPVFETIVLDDCSTDNSLDVIDEVAGNAGRIVNVIPNRVNSGNVFRQWSHGLDQCRGDHVWIAEADDLANKNFLSSSIAAFNRNTALSFCDSVQIDTDGRELASSYNYYYKTVDADLFKSSFNMEGQEFIHRAMAIKNVILNVSSVLWRTRALAEALASVGEELTDYRLVGDWRLYLEVLARQGNDMAYIAESLNTHRRHSESVTHSLDHERHLAEICAMHEVVAGKVSVGRNIDKATDEYVSELRVQFKLDDQSRDLAA